MLVSLLLAVGVIYAASQSVEQAVLTILLRTTDGTPATGVRVTLRPAPATLGGPITPLPAQEAVLDETGQAQFRDLGHWVWYVAFSGAFDGRALQPSPDQGKPPWGTNPAGAGFPLVLDPQLENEAGLATTTADVTTAIIYPFTLTLADTTWVPGLDLADPTISPVPLDGVLGNAAPAASFPIRSSTQSTPARSDLSVLLLLLIVGGVGLIALLRSWRQSASEPAPAEPFVSEDYDSAPSYPPGD